ncbi:uncharacterized protein LOC111297611 [Durio zibethinus]|uniref:Uncharacterized protein LOC111297611 n=1 Tax=Durio zibethinus TaxID=66656 RepID=A0A6P5Z6L9_DURZI|nr:uncharacterized protein LOC111297611 [Durio zibethinus]
MEITARTREKMEVLEQSHESGKIYCSGCGKLKSSPSFSCMDCGFRLDKQCFEAPPEMNHSFHHNHHFNLLVSATYQDRAFICGFYNKMGESGCVSPTPIIEDKIHHKHPSTLLQKQVSLICDACGTSWNYVPYICSTCNIIIHKKCISLPQVIQFHRHRHPILQSYFLEEHGFEKWECRMCYEEVNTKHGNKNVGLTLEYVTATSIKHFSHDHNLALSKDIKGDKQCDGCLLSISASYYYCSQCDFFLHKACQNYL